MAFADATAFPAKNQPFIIPVSIRDMDGNLVTGWTGAASSISVGGASAAAGATPTEVGSTGMGTLSLTADQMNGSLILVKVTVTNANALPYIAGIYTSDFSDDPSTFSTNRWDRILAATYAWLWNYKTTRRVAGRAASIFKVFRRGLDRTDANVFASVEIDATAADITQSELDAGPY